jgi:hypothetical protein
MTKQVELLQKHIEKLHKELILSKEKNKILQGRIDFYLKFMDRMAEDYNDDNTNS